MSVDAATVKRIGRLARIRIEDAEVEKYQGELNAILGFIEQLGEADRFELGLPSRDDQRNKS